MFVASRYSTRLRRNQNGRFREPVGPYFVGSGGASVYRPSGQRHSDLSRLSAHRRVTLAAPSGPNGYRYVFCIAVTRAKRSTENTKTQIPTRHTRNTRLHASIINDDHEDIRNDGLDSTAFTASCPPMAVGTAMETADARIQDRTVTWTRRDACHRSERTASTPRHRDCAPACGRARSRRFASASERCHQSRPSLFETAGLWMQALQCLWQPRFAAARLRTAVGARAAATERRCVGSAEEPGSPGLDRCSQGSLRLVIAGIVVLAWIDGYIVFLREVVQNAVITSFSPTEFYNEGTKLWHCLSCYCVKQATSFIRRNISDGN
jgi:hypothetical protein